jgi:glycosyltransferase involved in cell wall biosynthesis
MSRLNSPCLLDVTRMVARRWTGLRPTGIDRVCDAWLARFSGQAQAVVQHAGVFRIFGHRDSQRLFALLAGPERGFRRRMAAFAPFALARARSHMPEKGALYLNVSHTEFDRTGHQRWVAASGLRAVYLIHDLIPMTHPELCRNRAVTRHRGRVRGSLRNAAGIIVNSRATAAELEHYARSNGLPLPPMLTAPLAGADLGAAAHVTPPARPYFICLGTIEPRKNHALLLAVWRRLAARMGGGAPALIIAGQWGKGSAAVRRALEGDPLLRAHVTVLDSCDDAAIGALVRNARAMLLPSLAEGFGLPMVEALALGTPVIASDLPCFREFGQDIPALLDPLDEESWFETILAFTGDCAERRRQLGRLPSFSAPTWDEHFGLVEDWLDTLPARAGHPTHGLSPHRGAALYHAERSASPC